MASVEDWAAKAARRIKGEILSFIWQSPSLSKITKTLDNNLHEARIAAIIWMFGGDKWTAQWFALFVQPRLEY